MFTRFTEKFYPTRGEKAYLLGYVVTVLLSGIVALIVMAGLEAPYALTTQPTNFVYWVFFAGAMSGGVALYLASGWMAGLGMMGFARAIVGAIAVAVIGAVITGTLTVPFDGTIYGPVMMLSAFIAKPWLAALWFAGMLGAHYLMSILTEERAYGLGRDTHRSVTSQLSSLSRAQLYRRN